MQATPLHDSALMGSLPKVAAACKPELIEAKDENGLTPLFYAVNGGDTTVVAFLIRKGANIAAQDIKGQTPLHRAADKGRIEIMKLLLDSGAPVDARTTIDGWTPLISAIDKKHKDAVAMLIKRGANVNYRDGKNKTPLFWAKRLPGNEPIVHLLKAAGATE